MSLSISKPNTAKRRKQAETTLSAHLLAKSKHTRPKISPFELEPHLESLTVLESKQLKAVKDINYQYVELFQGLFEGQGKGIGEFQGKMSRERRYQLECMKILKRCKENVGKLGAIRQVHEDWRLISQYLADRQQKQPLNLIPHYQNLASQLTETQLQHSLLLQSSLAALPQLQNRPDPSLTSTEKAYKKTQKKLTKILNEQQYYELKCQYEQQKLEALQKKIRDLEDNKLNLAMKIVGESGKRDRMARKEREKREKSGTPGRGPKEGRDENVVRSKSSVRYQPRNL